MATVPMHTYLARLDFAPRHDAFFLHLVFYPLQIGLAAVEQAVAGPVCSLLLNGKWQDISARGARSLRQAIAKT